MNKPTGLVTSRMSPKNTRICRTPMLVMDVSSKLLGLEHRPPEIHEQKRGDDPRNDVVEHGLRSYTRSQAFVIAQSSAKPAVPMARYNTSSMGQLLETICRRVR